MKRSSDRIVGDLPGVPYLGALSESLVMVPLALESMPFGVPLVSIIGDDDEVVGDDEVDISLGRLSAYAYENRSKMVAQGSSQCSGLRAFMPLVPIECSNQLFN